MFSQTAEYALRAAVWLAGHPDQPLTTQEIAHATHVPAGYLSKVLQAMGRANLVSAQRGLHGGFTLGRPANQLTVLDVINAVDPVRRIIRCPLGLSTHGENLCSLHKKLDAALATVEESLRSMTLDELLCDETSSTPLCENHPASAAGVSAAATRAKALPRTAR